MIQRGEHIKFYQSRQKIRKQQIIQKDVIHYIVACETKRLMIRFSSGCPYLAATRKQGLNVCMTIIKRIYTLSIHLTHGCQKNIINIKLDNTSQNIKQQASPLICDRTTSSNTSSVVMLEPDVELELLPIRIIGPIRMQSTCTTLSSEIC